MVERAKPGREPDGGRKAGPVAGVRPGEAADGVELPRIDLAVAQQPLAEQLRHAVGHEVAREELAPVTLVPDELGQVLDALAHPVVMDHRIEAAGLLDGLDHEMAPLAARLLLVGTSVGMPLTLQCSRISTSIAAAR